MTINENSTAMTIHEGNLGASHQQRPPRSTSRARHLMSLLAIAVLGLCVAPTVARACPSRPDPFFIEVVAKGDGATESEGFLAAVEKLSARVQLLGDGLHLTPAPRFIVGKTDVSRVPFGEGGERVTVTVETWYVLDASAQTMESFSNSCVGREVVGIINEYDMEKYDQ